MADEVLCPECKRKLLGVLEVTDSVVDIYVHTVHIETSDCNWRQCRGCHAILCKSCDDAQRYYCCEEGLIVSRERAAAALRAEPDKHALWPVGPAGAHPQIPAPRADPIQNNRRK
jgi:hypothetical protein